MKIFESDCAASAAQKSKLEKEIVQAMAALKATTGQQSKLIQMKREAEAEEEDDMGENEIAELDEEIVARKATVHKLQVPKTVFTDAFHPLLSRRRVGSLVFFLQAEMGELEPQLQGLQERCEAAKAMLDSLRAENQAKRADLDQQVSELRSFADEQAKSWFLPHPTPRKRQNAENSRYAPLPLPEREGGGGGERE